MQEKAELRQAHLRTLDRAWIHLRAVELDLQVLRSEFGPDLHEINTQLHELREKMKHQRLDGQGSKESHPEQDPPPVPVEPQANQNGGPDSPEALPDQTR